MDGPSAAPEIGTTSARWWILCVWFWLAMLQGLAFNTYQPISANVRRLYGWTDTTIDWAANSANLLYMIGCPIVSYLANRFGLRWMTVLSAILLSAMAALRLIPATGTLRVVLAITALAFNGLAASWNSFGGAMVSQTWFAEHERASATAVMTMANYIGLAIGFVLGPAMVPDGAPLSDLNKLLYAQAAAVFAWSIAAFLYFPDAPSIFPSESAAAAAAGSSSSDPSPSGYSRLAVEDAKGEPGVSLNRADGDEDNTASDQGGWGLLFCAAVTCCRWTPREGSGQDGVVGARSTGSVLVRVWAIALVYGVAVGIYCGWTGILDIILAPIGLSETDAGWIGFLMTLAGCAGAVVVGRANDSFRGQMKTTIMLCITLAGMGGLYLWLIASGVVPGGKTLLYTVCVWIGFFINCSIPLFFELMMETVYESKDVSETAATGLLTFLNGGVQAIYVGVPAVAAVTNQLLTLGLLASLLVLALFQAEYPREKVDRRAKGERQGVDVDDSDVGCLDAAGIF